jgi:glyoxylase-like metal-dependent hydrolase (beta-lactamase superfamily II)
MASAGLTAAAVPAAALLGQPTAMAATVTGCPPPTTAPVPPPAKGPAIPKSGYLLEEVAERTYWLTDGLYQMIFLVTAEGVVSVDAPPTIGNNILRAIASVTKARVTHAVYSHHHADHAGAMALYAGARRYAQREVAGLLRQAGDPNRPLPDVTFNDRLTIVAGGDRVELAYHGPNHSPGNIFTYLPAQRVLMLVDVVFPGWVPFAYLAESQNIPGWLEAPAQALGYPFRTFIGGHLTRLGTRDDVTIQQEYVADLKAAAANAIDAFNVDAVYAAVDDANPWAVFRAYLDGVAAQAADAVVPRWIDKLGGADVYTEANAYQLVESLRIDYGHLGPFGIHPSPRRTRPPARCPGRGTGRQGGSVCTAVRPGDRTAGAPRHRRHSLLRKQLS